jgi:hypothetical protein
MMNTGHGFLKLDLRLLRALVGFWYMPIIVSPGVGAGLVRRRRIVRAIVRWGHPGGVPWDAATWQAYRAPLRERARARHAAALRSVPGARVPANSARLV